MKTNKAIVLCAGMSSRMKKLVSGNDVPESLKEEALNKPKSMIGLGPQQEPFLVYLIKAYYDAGVKEFCLVLNEKDRFSKDFFLNAQNSFLEDCSFHFAVQQIPEGRTKPLGTAQALEVGLKAVPQWSGHSFLVSNGDNLYSSKVIKTLAFSEAKNALVAYDARTVHPDQERIKNYALLKIQSDLLKDIVEKPDEETLRNWGEPWVSMNIWKLYYEEALPILESTPMNPLRKEKELPESMRMLAAEQELYCYYTNESVPDLTSQNDIVKVQEIIRKIRI